MLWLIVAILAYFFLAVVSLFDRYFLIGPTPNPKVYTFQVGILWFLIGLLFLPFVNFLGINIIFLGILAGLVRIVAIFYLSKSITENEISRVMPAIGGFLPIFSFLLFFLYFPKSESFSLIQGAAFFLLLVGSVLISLKKFSLKDFNFKILKCPFIAAFFFALNFFLSKKLYLETDFFNGLFLILFGGGLGAIVFLIFPEVREAIFGKKIVSKVSGLFVVGQAFGGIGVLFQQYAIFLAKPGQVPLINALEGIRYVFLLVFTILLSIKFPQILKEETSEKILVHKIFAILLIMVGLVFLAFK